MISSPPIKQTSQKRWLELLLKAATRLSLLAVYNHGPDPRGDSGLKAGAVAGPRISLVVVVVVVVMYVAIALIYSAIARYPR